MRGQLLLQRGAGAVRCLPGQLNLVGGHECQLARNVHLRFRLHLAEQRRQPSVHVPSRIRRHRNELLAVQRRDLLVGGRVSDVLAVRGRHYCSHIRSNDLLSVHWR